jgi:alanine dehydrogenase
MGELLVLSRDDVASLLDRDALVAALRSAFVELSAGRASVPPRVAARTDAGILGAMPGFAPGLPLGLKAVTVFPGNLGSSLPSHQGVIVTFDASNGAPVAVIDASLITEIRTATSAAIAADICAAPTASVLAVIGAGALGREHLHAFASLRGWTEIRIASRTRDRAVRLADEVGDHVRAVASFDAAVVGADVVCLCTDAEEPFLDADSVGAAAHVSSVGRGAELPRSLVDDAAAAGRLVVEWRGAATYAVPAGAAELQHLDAGQVVELGELISGAATLGSAGRSVYKSTGHAIEDMAAASVVLAAARRAGRGQRVEI